MSNETKAIDPSTVSSPSALLVWKRGQEAAREEPEPMTGRICPACGKHGVIRSVTGADGQFCHRDKAGVFLEMCPGKTAPEPAPNPYPTKCLHCDVIVGLAHREGCPQEYAHYPEPDRQPDPLFATELPRGSTWERWDL